MAAFPIFVRAGAAPKGSCRPLTGSHGDRDDASPSLSLASSKRNIRQYHDHEYSRFIRTATRNTHEKEGSWEGKKTHTAVQSTSAGGVARKKRPSQRRRKRQHSKKVGNCSCLQPPAHRPCRSTSLIPRSAMAAPAEETPVVEETASPAAAARSRGFWFLGEDKSVHKALGGGKTADVLLWKDKKTSAAVVGGATVIWVLFEIVEYHLLTLVSHVLIAALTILFLWSNATVFIKKSPPDVPEVQISEELAVNVALALRADTNKALALLREIALGRNLMKFLGVIFALWILSEIGELCELLRLMYIAVLILHTVPILYHKYQDQVDDFAAKAHRELCKQYKVLDAKVLSKIPRAPPKDKKQN